MKKLISFILSAALLLTLSACGAAPAASVQTHTVTDHLGNAVEVPVEINRIAVCDILPLPSVLAVFALNFNALFTEYDMGATFQSSYGKTYAMVIQNMCNEEGRDGYNVNATGRRNASTVFIMVVSGLILYLVYGVGARDLGERLEAREKRRRMYQKVTAVFRPNKAKPQFHMRP